METATDIINKLALLVPILLVVGAGWKYLPVVKNFTNELIPLINAVVAFLVAFAGGTSTAHAGFFGDLGKELSIPGQMLLAVLASYITSKIHDKFILGLSPHSPGTRSPK